MTTTEPTTKYNDVDEALDARREQGIRFLPFQTPADVTAQFHNRILAATGHRPQRTGGFSEEARLRLHRLAVNWLSALRPRGCISGAALGWDSAIISACLELQLSYIAVVPFSTQDAKWNIEDRRRYQTYLERAAKVIVCSPGNFTREKMQIRNMKMVSLALKEGANHGILLSLWDGTGGGTRNCIDYAVRHGLPMVNVWTDFLIHRSYC